jgi:hypothetical protein
MAGKKNGTTDKPTHPEIVSLRNCIEDLKLWASSGNPVMKFVAHAWPAWLGDICEPEAVISILKEKLQEVPITDRQNLQIETFENCTIYDALDRLDRCFRDIVLFCQRLNLAPDTPLGQLAALPPEQWNIVQDQIREYKAAVGPAIDFLNFITDPSIEGSIAALVGPVGMETLEELKASPHPLARHLGEKLREELEGDSGLQWDWWKAIRLLDPLKVAEEWIKPTTCREGMRAEFNLFLGLDATEDQFEEYVIRCASNRSQRPRQFWLGCIESNIFQSWSSEALDILHRRPTVTDPAAFLPIAVDFADPRIDQLSPPQLATKLMAHLITQQDPQFQQLEIED